jgi:hypothetical protein
MGANMKLPIFFASGVLITAASLSWAQQPSPNTAVVTRGKAQQHQKMKPGLVRAQPKANRQWAIQGTGKSSAPNGQLNQSQPSYAEALRRYRHERHDRVWWKRRFTTIVLVGGGYYYWNAGYWCPAWGYDPAYEYYDYDGPIYTYGNLLPDQVIVNVQRALQQLGYYAGAISGALSGATRSAIAAYQEDNGLEVTAVVDGATVAALGLI